MQVSPGRAADRVESPNAAGLRDSTPEAES